LGVFIYLTHHSTSSQPSSAAGSTSSATTYLAQDAADGQFDFVVTTAPKCGISQVNDGFGNTVTAQGQFCRIRLQVTNKSNKSADFFDSNQKLIDTNGNEYDVSTEADSTAPGVLNYQSLNPGLEALGDIYFEMPKGAIPDHVVLHDSAFSGGVTVNLQPDPSLVPANNSPSPSSSTTPNLTIWYPKGYEEIVTGIAWRWSTIPCSTGEAYCQNVDVISQSRCSTLTLEINEIAKDKTTIVDNRTLKKQNVPATKTVTFNFPSTESQNAKAPYSQVASAACA
jgi:hypothetical protein